MREPVVGSSKDCSWMSNSLTTPEMPSRAVDAPMPLRAPPMASISSMKPMAPPSRRAAARSARKYADLAVGLAVVHRLEGRRRDEQEGHARLARHGLGHVGLAGARRPLEQHTAARGGAQLLANGVVREEQVQRADDLFAHDIATDDVVQPGLDVVGAVEHVRRTARGPHRHEQHERQEPDDDEARARVAARSGWPAAAADSTRPAPPSTPRGPTGTT